MKNFYLFFAVGIIIVLIGIAATIIFLSTTTRSPEKLQITPSPFAPHEEPTQIPTLETGPLLLESVSPDEIQRLTPGVSTAFVVSFKNIVIPKKLSINLSYFDDAKNISVPVATIITPNAPSRTFTIKTTEALRQTTQYTLSLSDTESGVEISKKIYMSNEVIPTPVNNNPALIPFLPYTTSNFVLEYLPSRNIYIFHFIYDENSSETVSEQFDKAKTDAKKFIESKKIDASKITIEWRSS